MSLLATKVLILLYVKICFKVWLTEMTEHTRKLPIFP